MRYSKIFSQLSVAGRKDLSAYKAVTAICPPAGSETPWTARHNEGAEGQIKGFGAIDRCTLEDLLFDTGRGCYREQVGCGQSIVAGFKLLALHGICLYERIPLTSF